MNEMNEINKKSKKNEFLRTLAAGFVVTLIFLLTGCMGMNSSFDCNVGSKGKCAPMSHINKLADYGAFNDRPSYKSSYLAANDRNERSDRKDKKGFPLNTFEGNPIRSNESIQQIWIGPYEDSNGNYHEPSYLYTVIKKGKWIGEPVGVIQD